MQTTVSTQEMINDRFLPLQSLQRTSRIELIQKPLHPGLDHADTIDLNTSLQYLTATYFTSSHVSSQALRPAQIERLLVLFESRGTSLRGIFFRSRSASLIAKPQKAFQTNAASYQI